MSVIEKDSAPGRTVTVASALAVLDKLGRNPLPASSTTAPEHAPS
ncbi:hypothetical protein [Streptomyces sp. PU_AKi4]